MNIRNATQADILQLTELKSPKTKANNKTSAEMQAKRLHETEEGKAIYIVVEDSNQIIGHVFLKLYGSQTQPDYPNMQDLYISEQQRNQGLGIKLIEAAEKLAKENGYTKISLAVNPTLNPKAHALYQRLGYKKANTMPYIDGVYDGVEDWCVDMIKAL